MKNIKKLFLLLILYNAYAIIAMEQNTHLVVIPGQNGLGGDNIPEILPEYPQNQVLRVETPQTFPDFGQNRCINYLEKTLQPLLNNNQNIIIHASSQGTATALNYFEHIEETLTSVSKYKNNLNLIKALIVESVMLTGNSAIEHTLDMKNIPGAYYFMPYLAKIIYPFYAPAGKQACFSCNYLPNNLPIIILHAPRDPELSFQDSQALYASLRYKGHPNVYFIPIDHGYHVLMLNKNDVETKILKAILHKHELLPNISTELHNELSTIDLTPYRIYRPDLQPTWKQYFDDIIYKEKRFKWLDFGIKGILLTLTIYILYTKYLINKI